MRLIVDHHTTYRFSGPQARLTQLLRMTPSDTHDQSVARWDVHPDCDARLREGRDGFGNRATMLYVTGPIRAIEIIVTGEVLTMPNNGMIHGASEPLPPALFLRTPVDDGMAEWAQRAISGAKGDLDRLRRLNGAVQRDRQADVTHFLGAARSLGIPARYASGYSAALSGDPGQAVPHHWAEAYIEGLGWAAFDPATGRSADEAYVRVAVALDAAGAAPVAGSGLGEGLDEASGRPAPQTNAQN
jgi:transglutaminase-like putative cysteine protease